MTEKNLGCALIKLIDHMGFTSKSHSIFFHQTDADKSFLIAKGSVPIGIGMNSHIKRAIIDKNARIGDDVKVVI